MSISKLVGDIEVRTKNGGVLEGTGFLVGPNDLLTAAHVVHTGSKYIEANSITVYFNGQSFSAKVTWKSVPNAYTGGQDWGDDMALLTLDKAIGNTLGWMGMSSSTSKHASPINLAGYSYTAGSGVYNGDNLQTDYVNASYNYFSGQINYTSVDIHGGSSGGPAYWFGGGNQRYAVGIHVAGSNSSNTGTTSNLLTASDINLLKKLINNNGDGVSKTITGTNTSDNILGDDRSNVLYGRAGNDKIYGEGGSDRMFGSFGHDTLFGSGGNDYAVGSGGNDRLFGAIGNDTLISGAGNDYLHGGGSHDRLNGGAGRDRLLGANGNDFFVGAQGNDTLVGGPGIDTAYFNGPLRNYDVVKAGPRVKVIDKVGVNGTDVLIGFEKIKIGSVVMTVQQAIKAVGSPTSNSVPTKQVAQVDAPDRENFGAEGNAASSWTLNADDLLV